MESGGLALRVHMSETTAGLLDKLGGYDIKLRGEREVKGRGIMKTFWLTGKEGFTMPLPTLEMAVSESQVCCACQCYYRLLDRLVVLSNTRNMQITMPSLLPVPFAWRLCCAHAKVFASTSFFSFLFLF
jgi:hypothetical protein